MDEIKNTEVFKNIVSRRGFLKSAAVMSAILFVSGTQAIPEYFWSEKNEENLYWLVNEDACYAMEELSPEGFYFGSHPGDGACIGWFEFDSD